MVVSSKAFSTTILDFVSIKLSVMNEILVKIGLYVFHNSGFGSYDYHPFMPFLQMLFLIVLVKKSKIF